MESVVPEYQISGYIHERSAFWLPGIATLKVYKCRDGNHLIGANWDAVFARLCQAMVIPNY